MVGRPDKGRLLARKLTDYSLSLYASPGYLAAHPAPTEPADLARHRLVGYVEDLIAAPALNYTAEFLRGWRSTVELTSAIGQLEAVRSGAGIGVAPRLSRAGPRPRPGAAGPARRPLLLARHPREPARRRPGSRCSGLCHRRGSSLAGGLRSGVGRARPPTRPPCLGLKARLASYLPLDTSHPECGCWPARSRRDRLASRRHPAHRRSPRTAPACVFRKAARSKASAPGAMRGRLGQASRRDVRQLSGSARSEFGWLRSPPTRTGGSFGENHRASCSCLSSRSGSPCPAD